MYIKKCNACSTVGTGTVLATRIYKISFALKSQSTTIIQTVIFSKQTRNDSLLQNSSATATK
jgi:hypothetical protein